MFSEIYYDFMKENDFFYVIKININIVCNVIRFIYEEVYGLYSLFWFDLCIVEL